MASKVPLVIGKNLDFLCKSTKNVHEVISTIMKLHLGPMEFSEATKIVSKEKTDFEKSMALYSWILGQSEISLDQLISLFRTADNDHVANFLASQQSMDDPPKIVQKQGSFDEPSGGIFKEPRHQSRSDSTSSSGPSEPFQSSTSSVVGMTINSMTVGTLNSNVMSTPPSAPVPVKQDPPIWFNIQSPDESFWGRDDFITNLHHQLQTGGRVTVISQTKIVSGLGGVGKTETARMYIRRYKEFYHNIIWLDAETQTSLTTSFLDMLAENDHIIKVKTKTREGKQKEMKSIVKEMYDQICRHTSLLVFDNAETLQDTSGGKINGIRPFLPGELPPTLKVPFVLITSRNQDWKTLSKNICSLEVFTDEESTTFILNQLELIQNKENQEEAAKLGKLLGGLPLALQQAVAYIRQESNDQSFLLNSTTFSISDYMTAFKTEYDQMLDHPLEDSNYDKTVATTWRVTLDKIEQAPDGKLAIEIVQLLACLSPDGIPLSLLYAMMTTATPSAGSKGLWLLQKYALIKQRKDESLSIHRLVQHFILHSMKQNQKLETLLDSILTPSLNHLEKLPLADNKLKSVLNNLLHVANCTDLLAAKIEFSQFKHKLAWRFRESGNYTKAKELYQEVHQMECLLLGPEDPRTLASAHQVAAVLQYEGRYAEALEMLKNGLEDEKRILGAEHPATLTTEHKLAGVYLDQGQYDKALELYAQVHERRTRTLGPEDQETLRTQYNMAVCLSHQGKYEESLRIRRQVDQMRRRVLGPNHPDSLSTLNGIGFLLGQLGQLEEAMSVFDRVLEGRVQVLGPEHPLTLETNYQRAYIWQKQGRDEEALELFRNVHKLRKEKLGAEHPLTLRTCHNMSLVLHHQGKLKESMEMSSGLYEARKRVLGSDHPDSLSTLTNIAHLLQDSGDLDGAKGFYENVLEVRTRILGSLHPHTIQVEEALSALRLS